MWTRAWLMGLVLFGLASLAEARDFKVYPYTTPDQGEVELVYWWDYFVKSEKRYGYFGEILEKEGLQRHTVEMEYGLTDHWTVAAYADFEKPRDGDFEYVQARAVVTRYRFFEQGERFLDGAIYVEYYLPHQKYSDVEKIETRVILQKDIGKVSVILNPIFEKNIGGRECDGASGNSVCQSAAIERMEFEYAAGLYYRATPHLTPGIEFYGEMGPLSNLKPVSDREHFIFPRLGVKFGHGVSLDVGYGFGLTEDSDDQIIKTILELEFE